MIHGLNVSGLRGAKVDKFYILHKNLLNLHGLKGINMTYLTNLKKFPPYYTTAFIVWMCFLFGLAG
ncbi:MAG TPA: hypothetical protein DCL86_12210 [Bacteroidales bacterium]|jgi:hypothetical protein|nr:hypothetical protein [Bacteroidales bacterium]